MRDFHIHTKYSDGEYDEYQIIELVKSSGVKEFAICDHDTIEGVKRIKNIISNERDLIFHEGVELSCRVNEWKDGVNVHLLVRDFDINDENILSLIETVSNLRRLKIQRMIDMVKDVYGISFNEKELNQKIESTKSFGKPHVYELLKCYGEFDREEYYKHMNKLKSDDLKLDAISVLKVMGKSKGNVALAHPIEIMEEYNLSFEDIDSLIEYLASNGLEGVETRHSKHTKSDFEKFSKIAKKYDLFESEGSDYHGPNVKPHVRIGVCIKE